MVPDCSTSAENDGGHGGLSSASKNGVVAAECQLGPVLAGPGGGVEAEIPDAGQHEQVGFQVNSYGVANRDVTVVYELPQISCSTSIWQ